MKLTVLEDFDQEWMSQKKKAIQGILKKGHEEIFSIQDGEHKYFGSENINDFVIPDSEIDQRQFSINHSDGHVYLIDWSNEYPTRIQVDLGKYYRLTRDDYISLGLG